MAAAGRPRVKICCIATVEEAWMAVRHGASALGLVSAMPSGPGVIPEALIAEIARRVPPGVSSFLLTSRTDPDAIIEQQRRTGVDVIQLVDAVSPEVYDALRRSLPGTRLVQAVHVVDGGALSEAVAAARHADAILLDSGNPRLAVKELGGTGRIHDWSLSRRIRESVPVPLFLAGGLDPSNVGKAVEQVAPFGVDVCSGVRTEGRLDERKLARFMSSALGSGRGAAPAPFAERRT